MSDSISPATSASAIPHSTVPAGSTERWTDKKRYLWLIGLVVPSLAFLGYGGNAAGEAEIELTYNYGTEKYDLGSAFGHLAIGVPDVAAACESIRAAGGKVVREAGPVKHGTTIIAFVEDPDGYKLELIQRQ